MGDSSGGISFLMFELNAPVVWEIKGLKITTEIKRNLWRCSSHRNGTSYAGQSEKLAEAFTPTGFEQFHMDPNH